MVMIVYVTMVMLIYVYLVMLILIRLVYTVIVNDALVCYMQIVKIINTCILTKLVVLYHIVVYCCVSS